MCTADINDLIRVTGNFLFAQCGSNPKIEERKSIAETLHELFPQMQCESINKKLTQWLTNKRRAPKLQNAKVARTRIEACNMTEPIASNWKNDGNVLQADSVAGRHTEDYDDVLKSYNISAKKEYSKVSEVEFLDYEDIIDENVDDEETEEKHCSVELVDAGNNSTHVFEEYDLV